MHCHLTVDKILQLLIL